MRIVLQDDTGAELARLDGIGEGSIGLESVNAATGSVRLTYDTTLALAMMLHQAGVRPGGQPKPKDNMRAFNRPARADDGLEE